MNRYQELWLEQARSDHVLLVFFRQNGIHPCHQLHYLQMATEKLAKAYFWRSGTPPPRSHARFVDFMRSLGGVQRSQQARLAASLGFKSFAGMQSWIRSVMPMVYALERLAPGLAADGPNPEYPWPHGAPTHSPVGYHFDLWTQLASTGLGRRLAQFIGQAINRFPSYG